MKKAVIWVASGLVIVLIGFVLFNNKAAMEKKAKSDVLTSFPVSVTPVKKQQLTQELSQVGTIVSNNDVAVVSEISGKVTAVMVSQGSYVRKGSPLLKIEDVVPEANFIAAQANYEKAQKDYDSYKTLYAKGLISESDLDSARLAFKSAEAQYIAAQKQYHNSVITSPITGVVTARPVNIGDMVNPGTTVANVIDNSLFKVELNIGEKDAFKIKAGDGVIVATEAYPGVKIGGMVKSISDKADAAHTYPVEITIPSNKEYPLKSGMFGTVSFDLGTQNVLTVPRIAIVSSIKNPQVFVIRDRVAVLRNIVIGTQNDTDVAVSQGINEGEMVVISGQNNLRDKAKVTVLK
jgi:RND family efflux transporter MFP subunit